MPTFKPRNTERARTLRREATPIERLLWRHITGGAVGAKFSRQMPIGPYFADFLCREWKIVVELDGHSHDLRPDYDAARDRFMADAGYQVLRFTNADVRENCEAVVAMIALAIEAARVRKLRLSPDAHP
ncbi:endonuclease domain-containing protein [Novosphingobium sp.]|uniref:endonuclease domain-containing protein n=1 Tax=Novosphingobium sp. TaxID=1874826 RepID=UPI003562EF9D